MAARVDPTGSWKQMDMGQQLLKREMKAASGMMWNQDASKMLQDGICKMWRLAGLGLGRNEGARTVAQCGNGMIQIIVLLIMFCFFQAVKIYVMMV